MKKFTLLLIFVLSIQLAFSQVEINEEPVFYFYDVESIPVMSGCNPKQSRGELKKCFDESIRTIIRENFDAKLIPTSGLEAGTYNAVTSFEISTDGEIENLWSGIRPSGIESKIITDEVIRVMKLIPKIESPGMVHSRPVKVRFAHQFKFIVD